jgi:hypothetical protein
LKTILLHITNDGPRYHPQRQLPWSATNLPEGAFRLRENEPIYWRVRLSTYDKHQEELEVEVLDYQAAFDPAFAEQQPKMPVSKLRFFPLSPVRFKALLSYYDGRRLAEILQPLADETSSLLAPNAWTPPVEQGQDHFLPPSLIRDKPASVHLHFEERIQDLRFKLGIIGGTCFVEEWGIAIDYYVKNDFILPEFDYVKSYLSKALKRRRVPIELKTTLKAATDHAVLARSPVLEAIDENLLELVRSQAVERLLQKPKFDAPVDKSLFTGDEMFDQYASDDDPWGDALRTPEADLLAQILELREVRNAKQLQFLAGKVQATSERLRFTLSPQFGFLFTGHGARQRHLIWELLDSHATYLWSYDPDEVAPARALLELEQALNFIKVHGRQEYRNNHHLSEHLTFCPINHRHVNSKLIDGFPRWRHALLEQLV